MTLLITLLFSLPPGLLDAVEWQESRGNPAAVSASGCIGLLQVCPRYSHYTAAQLRDPSINRMEGARMLRYWHNRARGNWTLALAAYRCGNRGLRGTCGQGYARLVLVRLRAICPSCSIRPSSKSHRDQRLPSS